MNKLISFLLLLCISSNLSAQDFSKEKNHGIKERGKEKIKAIYIAFITQELNLNEQESEKFWPIHNQYDVELKQVHQKDINELEKEESALTVRKKYAIKFSKIIGTDRTYLFYKKDKEFRDKLIDKVRERRMKKNRENKPFNDKFENHP